ncbi:GNAT family N-acetyltransferase [Actinokineospora sp. NBRC 105648]|uniref:GNAT family N-acetyltransferase n=1 Tax=Actinokineospora sp. NBRC 105648 TaxID=3032206 RepID=UPI0024A1CD26|nr:GNAT family N-acetyltransferase [Actinokineospora sp. NBRC 105648]GLZ37751.1 N-acetyltransferase [Actinokineospora sp. NBRC 105648]
MGAPVLVREATPADASEIGRVHAEAWRAAYQDLFEGDLFRVLVERRRTGWPARLANLRGDTVLVALRTDRVVAFARHGTHPDNPHDGELRALYTHPGSWGSGVAQTLLDGVWEGSAGYRRLRLWTLTGANRARRFYTSAGFVETGLIRERDYGDGRPVLEVEYARRPPNPS